jgi:anaerobic ribonucleoside-triphosphate reductase activating protein
LPPDRGRALVIGGIVPFSTVDYPGWLSAVAFCQGCPWRCRYCHNPHLQNFTRTGNGWRDLVALLQQRRGKLEAVVFSGGEPTSQPGIGEAIRAARGLGYQVGLHTAGIHPRRLRRVLPLVSWVGLDIKAPFDARYDAITQLRGSWRAASAALDAVLASGVAYDLRTTRCRPLLDDAACADIERELARRHARPTRWQEFRPEGCTDPALTN